MSRDKQEWVGSAFVGIGIAAIGLFGALAAASAALGNDAIPIWLFAMVIVIVAVRSPIAKAFAHRLADSKQDLPADALPPELYAELDELRARLSELEERQDFSERLLATGRDSQRVNNG